MYNENNDMMKYFVRSNNSPPRVRRHHNVHACEMTKSETAVRNKKSVRSSGFR